jgi:hypothetical protein
MGEALMHLRDSMGPYTVRKVTVIDELGVEAARRGQTVGVMLRSSSVSFSADGRKITLTTVAPDPKGERPDRNVGPRAGNEILASGGPTRSAAKVANSWIVA